MKQLRWKDFSLVSGYDRSPSFCHEYAFLCADQ